jgi:hypothetical protein
VNHAIVVQVRHACSNIYGDATPMFFPCDDVLDPPCLTTKGTQLHKSNRYSRDLTVSPSHWESACAPDTGMRIATKEVVALAQSLRLQVAISWIHYLVGNPIGKVVVAQFHDHASSKG